MSLSLGLLFLEWTENRPLARLKAAALDHLSPVLEAASLPAGYIQRSIDRMSRLYALDRPVSQQQSDRRDYARLRQRLQKLEQTNTELRTLLNATRDPLVRSVSGRIISSVPALSGRRLLANIGRQHGIRSGYAVMGPEGFIGQTVETTQRTSHILLPTDPRSRIPVAIGKNSIRALLVGDGTAMPRIAFLPASRKLHDGAFVTTSGDDGLLPKGLHVGVIRKIGDQYRVALAASARGIQYVTIVFAERPGLARQQAERK